MKGAELQVRGDAGLADGRHVVDRNLGRISMIGAVQIRHTFGTSLAGMSELIALRSRTYTLY